MFGKKISRFATRYIMEAILVVLCAAFTIMKPQFLTFDNLSNILYSIAMMGLIAFGMTMVIIAGEIDLSVGSAVAFSGCLTAYMIKAGIPVLIAIIASLAVGFLTGAFTGIMRTKFQVPSFITTLALFTGLKGGAMLISNGFPIIAPFPKWFTFIGGGQIFHIPFPVIIFVLGFLSINFLMNYTSFGRSVYAVGGNAAAARLCGINVTATKIWVLAITGMFAAFSGIMTAARIKSGTHSVAQGWELDVIAAVIIGGTSFNGGIGKVWGTLIGVVFIGVILNGMTLLNVPTFWQYVVRGFLILVAVLINQLQDRRVSD